jgi:hypothetical protein
MPPSRCASRRWRSFRHAARAPPGGRPDDARRRSTRVRPARAPPSPGSRASPTGGSCQRALSTPVSSSTSTDHSSPGVFATALSSATEESRSAGRESLLEQRGFEDPVQPEQPHTPAQVAVAGRVPETSNPPSASRRRDASEVRFTEETWTLDGKSEGERMEKVAGMDDAVAGSSYGWRALASPPAAFKTRVKGRSALPRPPCNPLNFPYSDSTLTTSLGWVTLMLTMVSPSATSS